MPAYKVTWFFESSQNAQIGTNSDLGWTETWYGSDTGDIDAMLQHQEVARYAHLRRLCLPQIYRIAFVRVSQEGNPRRVKIAAYNNAFGALSAASINAQVQCAVLVDFQAIPRLNVDVREPVHHRRFLIRACPPDIINGNVLNPGGVGWSQLEQFLVYLGTKTSGSPRPLPFIQPFWQIKFHDPTVGKILITSLTVDNSNARRIRVGPDQPEWLDAASGSTANPPTRVKVYDVSQGMEATNRVWTLLNRDTAPPANKMIFGTTRKDLAVQSISSVLGVGWMRRESFLYDTPTQYTVIGLRSKKTGRSFRLLRGRSRNR